MSFALSAGVTGMQAHQKMLDVAGNNLANVNTTAFKASRITFSELLSETMKKASQPTATVGGTNPQQMGSGVGISSITPNMSQGNIVNTGNPLDLAIEGEGYFVLSDGQQNIYTRSGLFAVDADSNLVDPSTGYLIQRIGREGESDGFQEPGDSNVHVPYDAAMPASSTSKIKVAGNLSADATFVDGTQTQVLSSNITYTTNEGTIATAGTEIDQLSQFSGGSGTSGQLGASQSGTITISGYNPDGTELSGTLEFTVNSDTTLGDFIDHLNNNVLNGATASIVNGKIRITDDVSGYSKTDITLAYSGDGSLTTPGYFEILTAGGDEVKNISITVYDSLGGKHVLSGAFIRTDTANTWDMVLTSITGDVHEITPENRRVEGITFDATDGSFTGLSSSDPSQFVITFGHDTLHPQTVDIWMGAIGQMDGLTQFKGSSTAVAREQDGYEAGRLSTVSVNNEGILIGAFSNGIKKNIATLQIALFQNTSGLESVGGNYFIPSANSGGAVATQAMTGGAGSIHGGALEKSNADVATEFVTLIQAQNGYQANARTIRVANDILRELSNLIR
jgi:flagellar hook protein FlgE